MVDHGGGPDTELGRPFFVENLEKRIAEMTRLANDPQASLVEAFGSTRTLEQIVPIIDGLVNDHEGQYQVNVPNRGALEGVPDDVVVEVPAIVSMKGIQPIKVGSLPPKIMFECILPHWLEMERNLLSFKIGDRGGCWRDHGDRGGPLPGRTVPLCLSSGPLFARPEGTAPGWVTLTFGRRMGRDKTEKGLCARH